MVLPQPVGPTMAMRWPGCAARLKSSISGTSGTIGKATSPDFHAAIRAREGLGVRRVRRSAGLVDQCRTRALAEAMARLQVASATPVDLVEGLGVLVRVSEEAGEHAHAERRRKWRRSRRIRPRRRTRWIFTNRVHGLVMDEKNSARHAAHRAARSLISSNRASQVSSREKTFTTFCPPDGFLHQRGHFRRAFRAAP